MIFNKWCSLTHNYCLMYMFILVISLFFPVYSMAYKTFNALLQLIIFRVQYNERHTMMHHCDRYITHLQQYKWNWYIFYTILSKSRSRRSWRSRSRSRRSNTQRSTPMRNVRRSRSPVSVNALSDLCVYDTGENFI
jgi:hypothetical protein